MGEEDGARETRKQERPGTGKAESQGERGRKGDQRREGIREREKEQVINWGGGLGLPKHRLETRALPKLLTAPPWVTEPIGSSCENSPVISLSLSRTVTLEGPWLTDTISI